MFMFMVIGLLKLNQFLTLTLQMVHDVNIVFPINSAKTVLVVFMISDPNIGTLASSTAESQFPLDRLVKTFHYVGAFTQCFSYNMQFKS